MNSVHQPLPICYEDDQIIAINKPAGLLVHRTPISEDTVFALQLLRNQIGQRVYPIHRLDRATSGLLLFGKNQHAAGLIAEQFRNKTVEKQYVAIIRGFVEAEGVIDYPLVNKTHLPPQEAITAYTRMDQTEMNFAVNRYPTSRYSLINIFPKTGRNHQIRRHFAHIRHPIIGDKKHGDCKHNKYFATHFETTQMMLHAMSLKFEHPNSSNELTLKANLPKAFTSMMQLLNLSFPIGKISE